MAELSGLYQEIETLKSIAPIALRQAYLEASGDGPADGGSYWQGTREILDRAGITIGGIMTREAKDILTGATTRQLGTMPPKQRLRELLTQNRAAIMAAMPKHMNPDRLLRVAQTACTSTPQLMECYVPSLLGGIMQAAQFGLEPNTPMGHCYLVPYRRNMAKRGQPPQHRQDCQLIIGYRGLIDLARRSGQIVSISAHAVRDGDLFDWEYGLEEKLRHRPADGERGEITHVYAVAKMVGGGHAMEVMALQDVVAVMKGTQSGGKWGPWRDHFEEMARKTAIRRLAKYLPMTVELAAATEGDSSISELTSDGEIDSVAFDDAFFEDGGSVEKPNVHRAKLKPEWIAANNPPEQPEEQPEEQPQAQPEPQQQASHGWPRSVPGQRGGSVWADSAGEVFDPQRHATSRDGRPAVVSDGRFRARRGAAAAKPAGARGTAPPQEQIPPQPTPEPANGGGATSYDGPSVDMVMRMIRENVADMDGVADVQAILADMPGTMLGKDQCVAALERAAAKVAGA